MTFLFTFSFQFLPPDPWPLTSALSPLTSTNSYVRNYKLFLQNEPKFRKSQVNVNNVLTTDYEKWTLGQLGKTNPNEPKTNPKRTQTQKGRNERNVLHNKGI